MSVLPFLTLTLLFAAGAPAAPPSAPATPPAPGAGPAGEVAPPAEPVKRCNDPAIIQGLIREQQERIATVRSEHIGAEMVRTATDKTLAVLKHLRAVDHDARRDLLLPAAVEAAKAVSVTRGPASACVALASGDPASCGDRDGGPGAAACRLVAGLPAVPTRLLLGGLVPTTAALLGRLRGLVEAVQAQSRLPAMPEACAFVALGAVFNPDCAKRPPSGNCDIGAWCAALLQRDPERCPEVEVWQPGSYAGRLTPAAVLRWPTQSSDGKAGEERLVVLNIASNPVDCDLVVAPFALPFGPATVFPLGRVAGIGIEHFRLPDAFQQPDAPPTVVQCRPAVGASASGAPAAAAAPAPAPAPAGP